MPYAEKTCPECSRWYRPSSRHSQCPACRKELQKVPCLSCGQLKQRRAEACRSCYSQAWDKNPNWKGGEITHSKGYLMVRMPFSAGTKTKYKFHHVLVMENHLGRELTKAENVHHINGVRDDNRIQNLELWIRPQPTGVRVEDAVAWAREVIALYDPPTS